MSPGLKVRCGSRRRSQCPACASIWAGDSAKLGRSGFEDADGHPVGGYRFLFLTLTAPSFGRTHLVVKWERDEGKRCGCGATHGRDETSLRGLPLDLDGYDYAGQVRWHQNLGKLWNVTVGRMRRLVPDMEFYRVFEAQARGALHAHAIVRVPEWPAVTATELLAEAQAATTTAGWHNIASYPDAYVDDTTGELRVETYAWGSKGDAREVKARHRDAEGVLPDESQSLLRVLGYTLKTLVKYQLKDLSFGGRMEDITPERMLFMQRLTTAARWQRCPKCPDAGAAECASPGHRQFGFAGHVLSMSRQITEVVEVSPGVFETVVVRPGWSFAGLTRRRLRAERRAWMEANAPADMGNGLDASQVQLMEWLNERRAARWAEQSTAYARAP